MTKKYDELLKDFQKGIFSPIYILYGEEPFYIDALANKFENEFLDEDAKDFNLTLLYGRDVNDLSQIITSAQQYPVLSERRLVLVKEAQEIDKRVLVWSKFDNYIANPTLSSVIVICYKYKAPDKAFIKKLDKNGCIFESKKIYDSAIASWISNYGKTIGLTINETSSQLMADYLGNDLKKIANELSKLKLNLSNREKVEVEDIEKQIGISKDYNVFELQKALMVKDVLKANMIINYFEANSKNNPIQMVISSLHGLFVKLIIAIEQNDKSPQNIAKTIGVNPYFVKDYLVALRHYNINKLFYILSLLREYDLKSKGLNSSNETTSGELLKELIFKIIH
ncbi:MAG: DNA polymerase III subunit delta [Bacteroidales bacterium]|jgi:DNA polymerase-3 subunit delta|nr:DNA polymerase III subunit delta [Bacteroidales bacterium]